VWEERFQNQINSEETFLPCSWAANMCRRSGRDWSGNQVVEQPVRECQQSLPFWNSLPTGERDVNKWLSNKVIITMIQVLWEPRGGRESFCPGS
jgi:hypothetical protein